MEISLGEHIRNVCQYIGFDPVKSKGQNFLIDRRVLGKIISAAEIKKTDKVLEIGPGLGVLSEELAQRAGKLAMIELDRELCAYLRLKFENAKQVKLWEGDAVRLLGQAVEWLGKDYKVVANLPYQISAHILRLLLAPDVGRQPTRMVLMLQREVAERLSAGAGQMSMLSLVAQYYGEIKIAARVGRRAFWPAPKVESSVVVWQRHRRRPELSPEETKELWRMAKIGFSQKRKMLKNNLAAVYPPEEIDAALDRANINKQARLQELELKNWLELYKELRKKS